MRSGLGTIQVGWRDRVMTGIVKIEEADHNCFILDVILKLLREESTWEMCECGGGLSSLARSEYGNLRKSTLLDSLYTRCP